MIYAVLNFSNFSHGEIMSFGAMITILVTYWFQGLGISVHPSNRTHSVTGRYRWRDFTMSPARSTGI